MEGLGIGDAEWVLVEDVEVSCSWWLMPFVKGKMEQAHRDVCRKVVEKVEMQRRQQALAQESPKGKGKDRAGEIPDENIHTGYAEMQREHYAKPDGVQAGKATEGLVEADAQDSQRFEMAAPLPEKITYR